MNPVTDMLMLMDQTYERNAEKVRSNKDQKIIEAHEMSVRLAKETRQKLIKTATIGE